MGFVDFNKYHGYTSGDAIIGTIVAGYNGIFSSGVAVTTISTSDVLTICAESGVYVSSTMLYAVNIGDATSGQYLTYNGTKIAGAAISAEVSGEAVSGQIIYPFSAVFASGIVVDTISATTYGNMPATGGSARWTAGPTCFSTEANLFWVVAGTSNAVCYADGTPIKYDGENTTNAVWQYGIVTQYTTASGSAYFAGVPIQSGDQTVYWGGTELVDTRMYSINGAFADAANTKLLETDLLIGDVWNKAPAHVVRVSARQGSPATSGDQPAINIMLNSGLVIIDGSYSGLILSATSGAWVHTSSTVLSSNAALTYGKKIEVTVSPNAGVDSKDLTIILTITMDDKNVPSGA